MKYIFHYILFFLAAGILIGCTENSENASEFEPLPFLVETDWLQAHLNEANLRILDCTLYFPNYSDASAAMKIGIVSGREHWEQGHIPGSVFADLVNNLRGPQNTHIKSPMPTPEQFSSVMSQYGVGEGKRVVLYDDSNNNCAARVWWMLRAFGFDNAAVLNGGWKKWTVEERLISTAPPNYPPAQFVARPRPELIAIKDEVKAAINSQRTLLINALDPDEYAGRGPLRYGRPGHIPSSVNVPFIDLIDPETRTYLKQEQLRERFAMVDAMNKDRVITYCGGGIASSGDAFVLTLLGVDNVAVYNGSLAEWAADPTLPLVTGDISD